MNSTKAVFKKQLKDLRSNAEVLVQFIIFPVVAFAMTQLIVRGDSEVVDLAAAGLNDNMFITMMAAMFVGMALIPFVAGIVAEDREKKSLRFMVMAGVKPPAYLLGVGGVILFASLFPSLAFVIIGRFMGAEFWIFIALLMSGAVASTILGLTIGMLSKNQQAATGLAMPLALILGFGPMVAQFNEPIGRFLGFLYTQQLNVVMDSFYSVSGYQPEARMLWGSFGVIWGNIAAMVVLFSIVFAKKGLKG